MSAPALHPWSLPTRNAIIVARPPAISTVAVLIVCLYVLGGLIWLAVGAAVMRGAPAAPPRIGHSL